MKKAGMIASIVAVVLSLPFYGYRWNLFMHILGAILFMGNIVVTAVWFSLAKRSGNDDAIRFATGGVVWTDKLFTNPGVILLLLNGGIIGTPFFKAGASWLILSLVLFLVSGAIWGAMLVPLQKRMMKAAEATPLPETIHADMAKWFRIGGIATLLPLVTLVLMVYKPTLW